MIGIISDTHENEEYIRKSVKIFLDKKVDFAVHCGDIISPPMLEHFKRLKMKFILGNNDGETAGLNMMSKKMGWEPVTEEKEFEYRGKRFYAYHGMVRQKLDEKIKSGRYDYVLTGHTHTLRDDKIGKTRVINPGALFRVMQYTIALLDPEKDNLQFVEVK